MSDREEVLHLIRRAFGAPANAHQKAGEETLADWLAERDAKRDAEAVSAALDEAAELLLPYSGIGMGSAPTRSEVAAWLQGRAQSIRNREVVPDE